MSLNEFLSRIISSAFLNNLPAENVSRDSLLIHNFTKKSIISGTHYVDGHPGYFVPLEVQASIARIARLMIFR